MAMKISLLEAMVGFNEERFWGTIEDEHGRL